MRTRPEDELARQVQARAEEARQQAPPGNSASEGDLSETSEDLAYSQIVIVTARWILILSGLLIALWNPGPIGELRIQIAVILALAVANFYLHAQLLMRRPALDAVVYGASAADIAVITAIVLSQGGFGSPIYIFYFPAILAFSVAFPRALTLIYAGGVMAAYGVIALATADATEGNLQIILTRLIMIAAVAVCGSIYLGIEHDRRRAAVESQQALMAEIRERGASPNP